MLIDPPAQTSAVERWLTTARDQVRPGGCAVVVLPKRALRKRGTRQLPEWDAMSAIALAPHRLRPDLSEQIALVVLTPGDRGEDVLVIDASRRTDPSSTLHETTAKIIPDLSRTLKAWRRNSRVLDGFPTSVVARRRIRGGGIIELLPGEAPDAIEAKRTRSQRSFKRYSRMISPTCTRRSMSAR